MLIGQLSRLTGFSRDTIRYYEKIELIVLPRKARRNNNYKDYPEEVVHTLKAIRKYKELGFTLEEIRELLVLESIKVLDIRKLTQIVELKITSIDQEMEKLEEFRMKLVGEHRSLMQKKTGRVITLPEMRLAA